MPLVECPICNENKNEILLDLGMQPPANSLCNTYEEAISSERFELALRICNNCLYVWLTETVSPDKLFRNNAYITGVSSTTRRDMNSFFQSCLLNCNLAERGQVMDVASNDGTLLEYFKREGYEVLGVEPSKNAFALATKKGIPTINDFFNSNLSKELFDNHNKFDLITVTNVITHVENPTEFLEACKHLLNEKGSIGLEFYYFESIIANTAFDQIYHEHVSYFNFTTFQNLLKNVGLEAYYVEVVPSQGGSLRIFISRSGQHLIDESIPRLLVAEGSISEIKERYHNFATSVIKRAELIKEVLSNKCRTGKIIAGYGASAKATVLTNYLSLNGQTVKGIADLSSTKQGKYIPGSGIPVISPENLMDLSPDIVVIFSWNIAEEIVKQLSDQFEKSFIALQFMPKITEIAVDRVKSN